jgi:hypothetical protein
MPATSSLLRRDLWNTGIQGVNLTAAQRQHRLFRIDENIIAQNRYCKLTS